MFDMKFDGQPCIGFIECKLWSKVIGYAGFFKYYEKACMDSFPLSFMVCRKIQSSMSSSKASSNLENSLFNSAKKDKEEHTKRKRVTGPLKKIPKITPNSKKVKKVAKDPKDYFALLNDLWIDPKNHIDIYTVKYKNDTRNFTVSFLKTFQNPKGAFILVESSFNSAAI